MKILDNTVSKHNYVEDLEVAEIVCEEVGIEPVELGLEIKNTQLKASEDNYEIPEEIETDIVPGDLFEIGPHRLLCGDSTNVEDVKKLLNGNCPILMVTDPPYGVNYDANWRNYVLTPSNRAIAKVNNDDKVDWTEAFKLFPGNIMYVWHSALHTIEVGHNIEKSGFELITQIIWNKNNIVISRGDYHWKHEPCWYAVRKGKNHNWQGSRQEYTVWDIDKPNKSETGHSTQKPIECMSRPIRNNSKEGESVYDPFLGSGTTMVAAHQLNRICYGMEISPQYCQIIINRMQNLDPSLEIKRNGKPYEQT
jgi:DNA modification methylase